MKIIMLILHLHIDIRNIYKFKYNKYSKFYLKMTGKFNENEFDFTYS